jgi:hypothetical protein
LVAQALTCSWREAPPPLDLSEAALESILRRLEVGGLSGLVWWRTRSTSLHASPVGVKLQNTYRQQSLQALLQEREVERLLAILRAGGVDPILMKGWAVARLYPEPGLRPHGDIDLCVHPTQRRALTRVLALPEAQGFDVDRVHIELDRMGIREWDDIYARSRCLPLSKTEVRVLGPEDDLAFLCVHLLRHGASRPLWLCDIAAALETRPPQFDWDLCLGTDRRRAEWIGCALALAHQLLGARFDDVPPIIHGRRLPDWLLPEVLKTWEAQGARVWQRYGGSLTRYVGHPLAFARALRYRWPDPIQATIALNAPFNNLPRLPFQVADVALRTSRFLAAMRPKQIDSHDDIR